MRILRDPRDTTGQRFKNFFEKAKITLKTSQFSQSRRPEIRAFEMNIRPNGSSFCMPYDQIWSIPCDSYNLYRRRPIIDTYPDQVVTGAKNPDRHLCCVDSWKLD
jgi:hypothetical protein